MGEPRRKLVWIDRAGARRLTWLFVALAAVHSILARMTRGLVHVVAELAGVQPVP